MMHSKPTQLLCRHLINYCTDTRGVTGVAVERPFKAGRARRRPSDEDFIRRCARRADGTGRRRPEWGGGFPAQAQVFGPRAREGWGSAWTGRAENGLGRNLKFGPILLWKNYEIHNGLHSVGLKSFGLHSNGLKKFMGQNKIEIKVTNIASYFYLLW